MGKYLVIIPVYQNTHRNMPSSSSVPIDTEFEIVTRDAEDQIFYYRKAGFPLFGQRQIENHGNIDWREKRKCSIDVLLAVMTSVYLLYKKKLYWSNRYRHLIASYITFYYMPSWYRLKKAPVKTLVYLPKEREEDWKQIKIKESDRER